MARAQSYRQADDLNWLLQGSDLPAGERSAVPTDGDSADGLKGLAAAAAMDLGMGAVETPRQMVGGARDAVQSMLDLAEEFDSGNIPFTDIPASLGGVDDAGEDPRHYSFSFIGSCLGDWLRSGAELIVDMASEIEPLDLVSIVIKRSGGPWAGFINKQHPNTIGVTKFFLGSYETPSGLVYMAAQTAPLTVALFPADTIEAMHKVIGMSPGSTAPMSRDDLAAIEIIRPLCVGGAVQPVNSAWLRASA